MSLKHCPESIYGRHGFTRTGACVFCHQTKQSLQKRAQEIARTEIAKCRALLMGGMDALNRKVAQASLIESSEAT